MSAISIRLPDSLHHAAKILAKKEHISVNHFITLAVSEKLSALGAEEFLVERAKRGDRKKFLEVLKNAPNNDPDEFDRL
ncbi:MAG: toxin-antitoxin system HicB family antitoxin [Gammaproteobacteria bacterium]